MSEKKYVLVMQNDPTDFARLQSELQKRGFEAKLLPAPADCLAAASARKPDLVLLDAPSQDTPGRNALKAVREKYSPTELPVMMLLPPEGRAGIPELIEDGANEFLDNPIDYDLLQLRLKTQLTLVHQVSALRRLAGYESMAMLARKHNHDINNQLAIAISSLSGFESLRGEKCFERIEKALWQIAEVTKSLKNTISAAQSDPDVPEVTGKTG